MKYIKIIKKNIILLALVLILILYFVLKDDFANIITTLFSTDLKLILVAFIFMMLYLVLRAICLHMIVKEYSNDIKFSRLFSLTLITQFFNGITPFSSGGQPMEVYYLSKIGIKATKGTNVIIQNFIMYQMALIFYGIIAILLNYYFRFFADIPILRKLTLIGFAINTIVGIVLLFISFSTRFNKFIINLIIKIGYKFKVIKDKDQTIEKWSNRLCEFHESAEMLKKNKILFVKGFIYNFLSLTCFYIIPLFIIMSLGNFNINGIECITASAYVLIIGAFVPIPGGSGGIEYGFMQFFGNFVGGSQLSASLLVWRFITYYIPIIIGAFAISFFDRSEE